jgi:hypothetical protein
VEVAVGLDPAVGGDDRVVDRAGELALGDRGVVDGVAHGAGDLRGAAQRVGVLHPRAVVARWLATIPEPASSRRRFAGAGGLPGCGRSACRSAANTRSVPSSASTLIAAATSATAAARRGRERQHQHAEHAVGAVDEREALLLGELDRLDPGGGERSAAPARARRRRRAPPLAHERERAVGERGEVARAAEASRTRAPPG